MPADHLNVIERALIDELRNPTGSPWPSGSVTVFGQFPETSEIKYPCIIIEHVANGLETQFIGQKATFGSGSTEKTSEIYGMGFSIWVAVDKESSISVVPPGEAEAVQYKQRRLINYLQQQVANILMDVVFDATLTEVIERHFQGFRNMTYDSSREVWAARTSLLITFLNYR